MSTYPGEDPQQPADPSSSSQPPAEGRPDAPQDDREHTAPITPGSSGPVFNPTSAQPVSNQPPSGQPTSSYEQGYPPPYAGQPGEPSPYQQQYQQPYGGQNPYPAMPPGYQPPPSAPGYGAPYAFTPPLPNHPQSTTALVLGLVSLVGGLMLCGLPLLASPFAWALGRNSLKEIKAAPGRWGGESNARAGMIMGIIGTVLLALAIIGVVLFIVVLVATGTGSTSTI